MPWVLLLPAVVALGNPPRYSGDFRGYVNEAVDDVRAEFEVGPKGVSGDGIEYKEAQRPMTYHDRMRQEYGEEVEKHVEEELGAYGPNRKRLMESAMLEKRSGMIDQELTVLNHEVTEFTPGLQKSLASAMLQHNSKFNPVTMVAGAAAKAGIPGAAAVGKGLGAAFSQTHVIQGDYPYMCICGGEETITLENDPRGPVGTVLSPKEAGCPTNPQDFSCYMKHAAMMVPLMVLMGGIW